MTIFHVIQYSGNPAWKTGAPRWVARQLDLWFLDHQDMWPVATDTIQQQLSRIRLEYDPDIHGTEVVL